jgi:acetyltransferase-like isoleucine patch superfamily enzyme
LSSCGKDFVCKASAEFRLVEHAVLEVGDSVTIQDQCFFQLTMPNPTVFIGSNTVIGRRNIITAKNRIVIGSNVLIGSDVQIIDHSHGIARGKLIREQRAEIGEVTIGDDVWIGAGAKILMNSHIGTGAIIGANAVVRGDIPDYAIAVGAPARIVKYRE